MYPELGHRMLTQKAFGTTWIIFLVFLDIFDRYCTGNKFSGTVLYITGSGMGSKVKRSRY